LRDRAEGEGHAADVIDGDSVYPTDRYAIRLAGIERPRRAAPARSAQVGMCRSRCSCWHRAQ
jgi:endonuclease YncB( thermonuclease family)